MAWKGVPQIDKDKLQLFENKAIRTAWNEEKEEWYFSIVDVVAVLIDSPNPNNYWKVLKKRLKDEGNQLVTSCNQLKLKSHKDGKRYLTDVATTEQLLRIIQSIPSPKAEPFKLWLAEVGGERIEETIDPEQAIDRAFETYLKRDIPANGFIKGFYLSASEMNLQTNGAHTAYKRALNMRYSPTRSPARGQGCRCGNTKS